MKTNQTSDKPKARAAGRTFGSQRRVVRATQNTLFDEKHVCRDTYTFQINGGGEFYIEESGEVTIIFINGKFSEARFPLEGTYSRNGWRILAEIEKRITEIEATLLP